MSAGWVISKFTEQAKSIERDERRRDQSLLAVRAKLLRGDALSRIAHRNILPTHAIVGPEQSRAETSSLETLRGWLATTMSADAGTVIFRSRDPCASVSLPPRDAFEPSVVSVIGAR